jgi:hypothetical protein
MATADGRPFSFVRIPADAAQPLERLREVDTGLEADALKLAVQARFEGRLSDEAHTASVASELAAAGHALPADTLLASALAARRSVDITLLTVPIPSNGFLSVSLYGNPDAGAMGLPPNARASALARACGHPATAVLYGDVYLGRCKDDERGDVWARVSLEPEEAVPGAAWVEEAAAANRGKSLAGYTSGGALQGAMSGGGSGVGGAPRPDAWRSVPSNDAITWRESSDLAEVEVRVGGLPTGTRAKGLDVVLTSRRLGVALKGGGAGKGSGDVLFGPIDAESSAWQVEEGVGAVFTLVKTGPVPWPTLFK